MKGQVEVVKSEYEARFSWNPDESGSSWTVESLRSLLSGADIRVEISDADLEAALDFFESSDGGESEVVARGAAPVIPTAMKAEITGTAFPEGIESASVEILRAAAPFEGDDEPTVSWGSAGETVGTVIPPVAGRAGLALNRDPVAAPELEEEDFRIGSNLEVRGTLLVASVSGILRFTDSTADLVPCEPHSWNLTTGDGGGCFLSYTPGHGALPLPAVPDVITAAGRVGILEDKLVPAEKIRAMMATAVTENTVLDSVPITADTDSSISIRINDLKTRAELRLQRETGDGIPLELPAIAAAIRNSGLRGVNGDTVKAEIMAFWKSTDRQASITLKEGKDPERGPDRELELQIPFLEEEDAVPIRAKLESEPDSVRGLSSLRDFPAAAVSKMAPAEADIQAAKLGPAKSGKPGLDIYGAELPGFPGNDPEIRIHEGLEWDGNDLIARDNGIMDLGTTGDGITHVRIRPHQDAEIRIDISPDRLKAFVSTRLPTGTGASVSSERIQDAAEKAGIRKGIISEAVDDVVERSLTGEFITRELIAEGRLPMKGNTRLSLAVSGDPVKAPVPVKAGDVIGTVLAGDDAGWDVFGEPLMDEGTTLSEGDRIIREEEEGIVTLKAERGGHLIMAEGELFVRDVLDYVGDVSLASGNIRFPGRIKIDGSILSRVVVDGGEGVEVSQVVQAALINSGGNVTIGKGVKGEGKAVIRSQGTIRLGYAEEANILSTGDIEVGKALMNCRVKCNGKLEIPGGDGRVIGGSMKLKDGLVCADVGNQRGTETLVSFGQDYLVENQIDQVQKELVKIQDFLNKTDEMMADLEKKPGSGKKLIMIRQKKVDALKMQEKKNMRLFLLREKFERHFESEVKVTGTAWPGTTFESHGRLIKVEDPIKSIRISFNSEKGRLEKKPI